MHYGKEDTESYPIEPYKIPTASKLHGLDSNFLGFEDLFDKIDKFFDTKYSNYPPYNVVRNTANNYRIEIAVAGFDKDDIQVSKKDDELIVRASKQNKSEKTENFVYRNLASRDFILKYQLATGTEVNGVNLKNGVLFINLNRPDSQSKVETYEIVQL